MINEHIAIINKIGLGTNLYSEITLIPFAPDWNP